MLFPSYGQSGNGQPSEATIIFLRQRLFFCAIGYFFAASIIFSHIGSCAIGYFFAPSALRDQFAN
jgi:hypothetical protein